VPVPIAISVNMFGLRFTTEAAARLKNGQPAHSTTGVASASCVQASSQAGTACWTGWPGTRSDIASASSGTVSATPIQNRRVMSRSSGLTGSSAVTVRGSRAMPQMGQLPGSLRTISGCIGQTHSVRVAGSRGVSGSSAMPQLGQAPGPAWRTSGCIGQV
jgi:hypothetical protein